MAVAVAVVAVACSGSEQAETTVPTTGEPTTAATGGSSSSVTPSAVSSTTTIPTYSTTTEPVTLTPTAGSSTATIPATEPDVTFDSLSEDQQQFVGFICEQASMPDGGLADMWILMVLSGELGVPALEDAWNEIGGGRNSGASSCRRTDLRRDRMDAPTRRPHRVHETKKFPAPPGRTRRISPMSHSDRSGTGRSAVPR